jgi:uncharacterized protein (TIGR02271 family)
MADIRPASGSTIIAFFQNHSDALAAISELKDAGFTSSEIGLATTAGHGSSQGLNSGTDFSSSDLQSEELRSEDLQSSDLDSTSRDTSDDNVWEKIKNFFTGHDESYRGDSEAVNRSFEHLSVSGDRARYYGRGLEAGGALVTVNAEPTRLEQARQILIHNDADLRTSGFETEDTAVGYTGQENDRDRSIQLRGEMLRAVKERVQTGEVRLRKEVVTEHKTLDVPVMREEIVVERVDAGSATPVSGSIGDQGEIRIPVSEEQVRVTKEPVVTGQVRVTKRAVQGTQSVSDDVKHEELRVEQEGNVGVSDQTKPKGKKPAA